jgi:DNA-binding MarR family transcriptional regulator
VTGDEPDGGVRRVEGPGAGGELVVEVLVFMEVIGVPFGRAGRRAFPCERNILSAFPCVRNICRGLVRSSHGHARRPPLARSVARPREMTAWRPTSRPSGDLTAALEADLAPTGLTLGDYQVLVYLSEAEDERRCGCATWPEMLQLSPSGLTRRLDGLVRPAGRASRGPRSRPPGDARRAHRCRLSTRSRPRSRPRRERARRIFDHLDPDEVEAIASIFRKIRAGSTPSRMTEIAS